MPNPEIKLVLDVRAVSFAWSPDGWTIYLADTKEGSIDAVGFDADTGRLGDRRALARIPPQLGGPDSGAVNAQGYYWGAIHRGGRLHRYAPDGRLDREVPLPVENPTMVAFGENDLDVLYVTSATHGKPGRPPEGGLFRFRPGVTGWLRPPFGPVLPPRTDRNDTLGSSISSQEYRYRWVARRRVSDSFGAARRRAEAQFERRSQPQTRR